MIENTEIPKSSDVTDRRMGSHLNDGLGRKGLRHVIDDVRSITAWPMDDGTTVFDFKNGDLETSLRISNEAISAIHYLWISLKANKGIAA